jgi:hypothetical protein
MLRDQLKAAVETARESYRELEFATTNYTIRQAAHNAAESLQITAFRLDHPITSIQIEAPEIYVAKRLSATVIRFNAKVVAAMPKHLTLTNQVERITALKTAARTLDKLGDVEAAALAIRTRKLICRIERGSLKAGFGNVGIAEAEELRAIIKSVERLGDTG